jgi:hypothetical protein
LYSNDGTKYVGYFHENKKHGKGVIYSTNGKICRELWEFGVLTLSEGVENVPLTKNAETNHNNILYSNNTGSTKAYRSDVVNMNDENVNDLSFENYIGER